MPQPVRSCIGCRGRAAKTELLRIVWQPGPEQGRPTGRGGPVADPSQTAPGRGAYLHRAVDCLDLAIRRRALGRALRIEGRLVDPAPCRAALLPYVTVSVEASGEATSRNRVSVA